MKLLKYLFVVCFIILPITIFANGSVFILDYHTFLGPAKTTSTLDYTVDELAGQLDAIKALGYTFVTLDDCLSNKLNGNANILITIDDGNHSIAEAIDKVLLPRGIRPVLFVYPAIVKGNVRYAIKADSLKAWVEKGVDLGSHGYNHMPMSEKSFAKDPVQFMKEVRLPGPALQKLTGVTPHVFGYPFGVSSQTAQTEVAKAGYSWAFEADDTLHPVRFDDPSLNHMAVPRTIVYTWNLRSLFKGFAKNVGLKDYTASIPGNRKTMVPAVQRSTSQAKTTIDNEKVQAKAN